MAINRFGGCLCSAVCFKISNGIRSIVYCPCSECRKAQGSAFACNGVVNRDDFEIHSGRDAISTYQYTSVQQKHFCRFCGSPVMSTSSTVPDFVRIRLGTIESDISEQPVAHIFRNSKANWEQICGDLPQYDSYEPGR